jgi:hypothetical protein
MPVGKDTTCTSHRPVGRDQPRHGFTVLGACLERRRRQPQAQAHGLQAGFLARPHAQEGGLALGAPPFASNTASRSGGV